MAMHPELDVLFGGFEDLNFSAPDRMGYDRMEAGKFKRYCE